MALPQTCSWVCVQFSATLLVPAFSVCAGADWGPEEPPSPVRPGPWRNAGNVPCRGPWGHIFECPPAPTTVAIRAGRLFDSVTGQMLTKQVIIVQGEKIADVGPEGTVKIPAGTPRHRPQPGDGAARASSTRIRTVFNTREAQDDRGSVDAHRRRERAANLLAGFTTLRDMDSHGNGYQDVELKNAINRGAIDGPRMLVSGRASRAGDSRKPADTSGPIRVTLGRRRASPPCAKSLAERCGAHQAVPDAGVTSSMQKGEPQYVTTYQSEVLQAIIDEAHRNGKRTGCHSFGGEGLQNTISTAATPSSTATA